MEKFDIEKQTQEVMTYYRQGVTSTTQALADMEKFEYTNTITLDDRKHDIANFLGRPIDIYQGTWTTAQTAGSELIPQGILFPNALLANAQYQEKVRGFVGLSGVLNIRILVNPQKFQQGKIIMYYIPDYLNIPTKAKMIQASLAGRTGCPCTYINCEGGTATTLKIPYVNMHTFYNLPTNQGNFGALFVAVLLPLKSAIAGDSLGIRIQAWLENVDLQFPTAVLPVLTQGFEEKEMHENTVDPQDTDKTLTLSDVITNLKDFNFKPSYLAKTTGNLLQLAGYQKPVNLSPIHKNHLMTSAYMANSNGEFMGHKLSLSAQNEAPPCSNTAGSNMDEMNIKHIAQIPTYYRTFSVKTSMNQGTVVWSDNVHPAKFTQVGELGVMDSTMLGYVSSPFAQWRGKIVYTFHVAKTMLHSCTLRATFVPYLYAPFADSTAIPAGIDLDRAYQKTFDFKDKSEFSVVCEQCVTRPFLNIVNPFSIAEQSISKKNYSPGVLIIDVFLPLRAPETVVQEVDIAVFISGGPDIEFANPSAPIIYPYYDATNVNVQGLNDDEGHSRYSASNSSELFSASSIDKTPMASAFCTGEIITSIKSLMGRFGTYAISDELDYDTLLNIAPYDFQIPLKYADLATRADKAFDFIDFFSFLYAFYEGQVHLIIDPGYDGTINNTTMHCLMRSSLSNYFPVGKIPRASTNLAVTIKKQFYSSPFPKVIIKPSLEGVVNINPPNYKLTHILPVTVEEQDQNSIEESKYPFPIITLYNFGIKNKEGSKWKPTIFRACHDDFRFHYILGPPQVHFLDYEFAPANVPTQFPDVIYSNSYLTKTGGVAKGFFGLDFFINAYSLTTAIHAPNQFLALSRVNTNTIYILPEDVYRFSWYQNQIYIATSNFITNYTAYVLNVSPTLTGAMTRFLTAYQTVTPISPASQAVPFPASQVSFETVTYNSTNQTIQIPSWNMTLSIAQNSNYFKLPYPLLIATSDSANRQYILLGAGTNVQFTIGDNLNSIRVFIETTQVGSLIQSLPTSPGFPEGTPTYCPTLVDAR